MATAEKRGPVSQADRPRPRRLWTSTDRCRTERSRRGPQRPQSTGQRHRSNGEVVDVNRPARYALGTHFIMCCATATVSPLWLTTSMSESERRRSRSISLIV